MLKCLRIFWIPALLISLVGKYVVSGRGGENYYSTYSICNSNEVSNQTAWFINTRLNLRVPVKKQYTYQSTYRFSQFFKHFAFQYICRVFNHRIHIWI